MLSQEEKETEREACDRTGSTRPDIANVRRTLRKSISYVHVTNPKHTHALINIVRVLHCSENNRQNFGLHKTVYKYRHIF